jgi:hypothetical protein
MDKSFIHFRAAIKPSRKLPKVVKPSIGSFDDPSVTIAPHFSSVLMGCSSVVGSSRNNRLYALPMKLYAQFVRVVGSVHDQSIGPFSRPAAPFSFSHRNVVEGGLKQVYLCRGRRLQVNSERSTLAIDQNHKLCSLAALRFADFGPPFLAGTNVPSAKHSSHLILSRSLSSDKKALQRLRSVPSVDHFFKRRQTADELPYLAGSSLHGAPVQSIHRMPSKHLRLLAGGRPPNEDFFWAGRCGSILAHCSSVSLRHISVHRPCSTP